MTAISILDHGYVIALSTIFLFVILKSQPKIANQTFTTSEKVSMYLSNSIFLYLIAIVGAAIWFFQGRDLGQLGFRWPAVDHLWIYGSITLIFLAWYAWDLNRELQAEKLGETSRRWRKLTPFMPENKTEVPHGIHLGFAAGVCEEIIFRGFYINYFTFLFTGQSLGEISNPMNHWGVVAAIVIPGVMFALSHLYLGWSGVFKIVWLASLFGVIYVLSGSLLIVMLLHIFVDTVATLISPWVMSKSEPSSKIAEAT